MLETVSVPPPLGAKFGILGATGEPSSRLSITDEFAEQLEPMQFRDEICGAVVVVSANVASSALLPGPIRLSAVSASAAPARKPIANHNLTTEIFFRLFTIISHFLLTKLDSWRAARPKYHGVGLYRVIYYSSHVHQVF